MDDFVEATSIDRSAPEVWKTTLREDWSLWGPSGGYLSALAMRAAGEATSFERPISFSCQFLSRANFSSVEIKVESLRRGQRSEAMRVEILQGDKLILTSLIWVGSETEGGMIHDYAGKPRLPDPETLPTYAEVYPDEAIHPFMKRLGQRPINPAVHSDYIAPSEPELQSFFKLSPRPQHNDLFVDSARIFLLIDTAAWLATYPAHPTSGPSAWIAPNLDFYYRFHRPSTAYDWLYLKTRADLAEAGLIAATGEIRSPDGVLLATGASQLICYPRPSEF